MGITTSLTFAAGASPDKICQNITIVDDAETDTVEPEETFTVSITLPSTVTVGTPGVATVTIGRKFAATFIIVIQYLPNPHLLLGLAFIGGLY